MVTITVTNYDYDAGGRGLRKSGASCVARSDTTKPLRLNAKPVLKLRQREHV